MIKILKQNLSIIEECIFSVVKEKFKIKLIYDEEKIDNNNNNDKDHPLEDEIIDKFGGQIIK